MTETCFMIFNGGVNVAASKNDVNKIKNRYCCLDFIALKRV